MTKDPTIAEQCDTLQIQKVKIDHIQNQCFRNFQGSYIKQSKRGKLSVLVIYGKSRFDA